MSITDFVRAEEQHFHDEMSRARDAAQELLTQPDRGPWTRKSLIDAIIEQAGVGHDPARCAEDELIRDQHVRVQDGIIVPTSSEPSR